MSFITKVILPLLLLGTGLGAGLGYGHMQLENERRVLGEQIRDLQNKKNMIHKKYKEKSALVNQMHRIKAMLEGQKKTLEMEMVDLKKTMEEVTGDKKALLGDLGRCRKEIQTLEGKQKDLKDQVALVKREGQKKAQELEKEIQNKEENIRKLESEERRLESRLNRNKSELDRCSEKNAQLCILADEMLNRLENQGTVDSLLKLEPFTKIKRVELEHLAQEYQDRIEKQEYKKRN